MVGVGAKRLAVAAGTNNVVALVTSFNACSSVIVAVTGAVLKFEVEAAIEAVIEEVVGAKLSEEVVKFELESVVEAIFEPAVEAAVESDISE